MEKFNFRRYNLLLRKQIGESWLRQIVLAVVLIILFYLVLWLFNGIKDDVVMNENPVSDAYITYFITFLKIFVSLGVCSLAIGYQSAHSMPFINSTPDQIAHAVLPATTIEKFAVVLTCALVLSTVEASVAFVIADMLQYLIAGSSTIIDLSAIDVEQLTAYFGDWDIILRLIQNIYWPLIAALLLCSAWFAFCATWAYEKGFIVGIVIIWGTRQILTLFIGTRSDVMSRVTDVVLSHVEDKTTGQFVDTYNEILLWTTVVEVVIAIGLWIWNYYRMKRVKI